jgi:mannitol-specific phosphotransferase system IIBC component
MASINNISINNISINELLEDYSKSKNSIIIEEKFNQNIKHNINDIILNEINLMLDKNKLFNLYSLINNLFIYNINRYIDL